MSAKHAFWNKRKSLALSFAALVICLFFDRQILSAVQSIRNPVMDTILSWFSSYLTIAIVMLIMSSLFLYQSKKQGMILSLWLSFLVSALLAFIIKSAVHRPRPFGLVVKIPILGLQDFSFPSGHSTSAFSTVAIFDEEFRHIQVFWIGFACLVAFSRVYFAVHYPSDVIAGGIIGYLIGEGFSHIRRPEKRGKHR